jgi:hypothetical protein
MHCLSKNPLETAAMAMIQCTVGIFIVWVVVYVKLNNTCYPNNCTRFTVIRSPAEFELVSTKICYVGS